MKMFKDHLKESLKDPKFKGLYEEEKELLEVALRLQEESYCQELWMGFEPILLN